VLLQAVEDELKKDQKSNQKLSKKKDSATKKVADIKSQLAGLEFSDTDYDALDAEKAEVDASVKELNERIKLLEGSLKRRLEFSYTDPVRGFDRSKVKGLVANLIRVKDPVHATALEVVAGGKLFQVVVDDAITSKALLEKGGIAKRCTIIPMDKIRARHVAAPAKLRAEALAASFGTTAIPAIDLVSFDEDVRGAIEYVFGDTIVVGDKKAAEQICHATKTRTITLQGDTYDPSGTVSGGSKGNLGTTLEQMNELATATTALQLQSPLLHDLEAKLHAMKSSASLSSKLKAQLNVAKSELEAVEKHMSQTVYGHLIEKRDSFVSDIQTAEDEIVIMTAKRDEKWKLYEVLQEQEGELTQRREARLANIDRDVKDARDAVEETSKLARDAKSQLQTFALELESLKADCKAAEDARNAAKSTLNEAIQKESQSQILVDDIKTQYDEACEELLNLEGHLAKCSAQISELKKARTELVRKADNARLDAKKISVDISRIMKQRESASKTVSMLMKKHAWIESEKGAFGVSGGDYDFSGINANGLKHQLSDLKGEQESLVRSILFMFSLSIAY
jgi:structural maintenance of chromosome 2